MKIHYTNRLCIPQSMRQLRLFCTLLLLLLCLGAEQAFSQLSRLRADGKRIVNASNQEVIFKGINVGGWLLQEGYMIKPSFSGGGTQWSIKKRLYDQGQSDAAVEAFYQSWRDNFITKADIDYLASQGFNSVRLPLHYDLFLTAAQRAVRNGVARNASTYNSYVSSLTTWYNNNQLFNDQNLEGFRLTDSLLKWCAANNMYVVLDLHAAPGAAGTDANISDALMGNDLWNKPIYQDITVRLWQRISARYINDDRVGFYDLINEPNNVPANQSIHSLFERLINAIRAQGDTHLLMVEGNGWGNQYNYLEPFTFTNRSNLVYNAHRYGTSTSTTTTNGDANQINELGNINNFRNTHNVPVVVGETGENNSNWLRANIAAMNAAGVGWFHWTYKRFDGGENAALLRIPPPYLMDGAGNMSAVLNNIRFANNVKNTNTIAAVAPGRSSANAPVGKTIWLQGFNNKYVNSKNGQGAMWCDSDAPQAWELFTVVDAGNGKIALRGNNGMYVSSENGEQAITCNRPAIQGWEAFDWLETADGKVSLRGSNGLFISSENGAAAMTCTRPTASGWEAFGYSVVGNAQDVPDQEGPTAAPGQFKVVGYWPGWAGSPSTSKVPYNKLTNVNYAFLLPNNDGTLQGLDNPTALRALVTQSHAAGVKVSISIGGWNNGNDQGFENLARNASTRTTFVNAVIAFVNQYSLDGADIDWEYPDNGASADNYVLLMTELSTQLHGRGKLLTAAVVGENGASILSSVFPLVDYLTLMAYDENDYQHSTYSYAQRSLNYWRGRGLPKEKAILGVPFYGRPSWESYAQLLARGASPNADTYQGVGYNGIPTIKAKTNLAFDQGGGIMIWELSQDVTGANSLLNAINQVVLQRGDTTVTNPNPTTVPIGKTIWLQGFNSKYVNSRNGQGAMWCDSDTPQAWELFTVIDAGNGKIALRGNNGLYVSSENGEQAMTCNRPAIDGWEVFDWISNSDGSVSLRGSNGMYVSSENGEQAITCNRPAIDGWERFNWAAATALTASSIAAVQQEKTAVSIAANGSLLIYPNPVMKGSTLTVNVKKYNAAAPVHVSVVDVNKRVVAYKKANAAVVTLSTGNMAGGFYILTVTNGNNIFTSKVLIQ
ncbi:glycoside hydrolase family 18 [Chitinophaga pinensis DSM 2588]|uniref:Glycoside hydrolase family 18 n=2 Tax=Chitinophaga pinensis TaxID=79329 RepID=A0A979GQH9_CHIPD|nr:glycoside hydrolase family 18 [Chitinophaga pinensis DSM 2588]